MSWHNMMFTNNLFYGHCRVHERIKGRKNVRTGKKRHYQVRFRLRWLPAQKLTKLLHRFMHITNWVVKRGWLGKTHRRKKHHFMTNKACLNEHLWREIMKLPRVNSGNQFLGGNLYNVDRIITYTLEIGIVLRRLCMNWLDGDVRSYQNVCSPFWGE